MVKILVVTRGYPQSHNKMLGLFEKDQAIALKNAGLEVAYAVVDIRSCLKKRKFGFNHFFDNGLEIFEMNYPLGPMPRRMIEYFRKKALDNLYKYIVETFGRPDIVHAHFLNYGVISIDLCKKEKLPLVLTEHSSYMNSEKLSASVYKRATKTYDFCSAIISVSDSLRKNIKKITGYDSYVIQNIANIGDYKEIVKADKDSFVFAASGQLIRRKGFDVLIEAFSILANKYDNVYLKIFGDGPERRKLKNIVKKKNICQCVEFYGEYEKKDICKLYSECDAFVLPSRKETFGVVYIEALAMGLPVIATRCGGPENFITERFGYIVEKDNVNELANAMMKIINEKERFNKYDMQNYVKENFSADIIAKEIKKVYNIVLEEKCKY